MLPLHRRAARLLIGDALATPSGHRVDYIDANFDGHEPAFCVVAPGNRILFLSRNDNEEDRQDALRFALGYDWKRAGYAAPALEDWQMVREGAADNPLWNRPIRALTFPDQDYFFKPSPQTGRLRRRATIPHQRNYFPQKQGDAVLCIATSRCRGKRLTTEDQFAQGGLYAIKPRGEVVKGYLLLDSIEDTLLGNLSSAAIQEEGYSSVMNFAYAWNKAYGRYYEARRVYALRFSRIFTNTAEAQHLIRPQHAQQLSLLEGIRS